MELSQAIIRIINLELTALNQGAKLIKHAIYKLLNRRESMMLEQLHGSNKVVGIKQTRKAIKEDKAELVYLAEDIEPRLFEEIKELCKEKNIEIYYVTYLRNSKNEI